MLNAQAHELTSWVPGWCSWAVVEALPGVTLWKILRSLKHALKGDCGPLFFLSLLLSGHELFLFCYMLLHDVLPHHRPQSNGLIDHGLKHPKLRAQINLLFMYVDYLRCFILVTENILMHVGKFCGFSES